MLRSLSRKRDSVMYTAGSGVSAAQGHGKLPEKHESLRPAALEVDADGAVVLHHNPADAMSRTCQQPSGRTLRQQRTIGREPIGNSRRASGTPGAGSIGAAHGPDLNAKSLKRFGTLKNNKAVYSPLQGTPSMTASNVNRDPSGLPTEEALPHAVSAMDYLQSKRCQESPVISEMENLAIDTHQHWLDAFTLAPIPAVVIERDHTTADVAIHEILQANSAAVMVLGRDARVLKSQNVEDIIRKSGASEDLQLGCGTASGLAFRLDQCSVQTVHTEFEASVVLIPVSDVCVVGQPTCYLALILDADTAVPAAMSALPSIPSIEDVASGIDSSKARKGMYSSAVVGQMQPATAEPHREGYYQAQALQVAHAEAAQRRLDGQCPQCMLPSPYNVAAWITKFETLLTVPANK